MADTVGVNYQWPRALHTALKILAEHDEATVKETLFRCVDREIGSRLLGEMWDPKLAKRLEAAGVEFDLGGYPVLR
jgi:hypothetical protein